MKHLFSVAQATLLSLHALAGEPISPFSLRAETLDARSILVRLDIPDGTERRR